MLGFKVLIAFIILLLYFSVQWKLFVATEKRIIWNRKQKLPYAVKLKTPLFEGSVPKEQRKIKWTKRTSGTTCLSNILLCLVLT